MITPIYVKLLGAWYCIALGAYIFCLQFFLPCLPLWFTVGGVFFLLP